MTRKPENSWIFLIKDLFRSNNFDIISLPHPVTNAPNKYCVDTINKKMYEIITHKEEFRSWFIGESVRSDSSVQILTPINPLFLVLPKLRDQCSKRAVPLDDLLSEKGFNKIIFFLTNMELIADLKGPTDIQAYKYNEEKTLNWLETRVRKLSKVLKDKNIHVTPGAASATFVTSNIKNEDIDDEFYLRYAYTLLSEYLQEDLANALQKIFNFKPELIESLSKKRKSEPNMEDTRINKKIKTDQKENIETKTDLKEVKKLTPLTNKEKSRQKAASGSKTISSFFKKS